MTEARRTEQSGRRRRAALVTGASRGLGAEIAVELARAGLDVAVTARRKADLAGTLERIAQAGARGVPVALDLRSLDGIERTLAEAAEALEGLDTLVNNAAVSLRRPALEVTPEEWDALMAVNLKGVFFTTQRMARRLIAARRGGCIVTLASTHGLVGYPGRAAYGIAKAGLIQMTRALAIEWAPHGIRVNAVAPGTVDSPSRAAYFDARPEEKREMIERVPLQRFATMAEVAAMVRYLAGPEAAYVTGQTLALDGGLTAG